MPISRRGRDAAFVLSFAFVPALGGCASGAPKAGTNATKPTAAHTAVDRALAWLVAHQDADGRWDSDGFWRRDADGSAEDGVGNATHDVGTTALAVLALLDGGSTTGSGPHQAAVQKAVTWLQGQQNENGLFSRPTAQDYIYDHAIATFAMCEAFGLSDQPALRSPAQKGVDYLEAHRNPYGVWRYQPRDNDNDTSVTTWAVLALVSAQGHGLTVNPAACKNALVWYDAVTDDAGRAGYTKRGEPSSRLTGQHVATFPVGNGEAMTAAAAFARSLLGQTPSATPVLRAAVDCIAAKPPRWENGHVDAVYWYFGTQACFQAGGEAWTRWNAALATLVDHQCTTGRHAGSWDPVGVWDGVGGRVFVTALNALSLQARVRHAKVVR